MAAEAKYSAQPARLRDGNWGVRTNPDVEPGDVVCVITRTGKSWNSVVTRITARYDNAALCEAESLRGLHGSAERTRFAEMYRQPTEPQHEAVEVANDTDTNALRALSSATAAPVEPVIVPGLPDGTLRGYQQAGVAYMLDCPRSIQADDMGLGKTLQTLAVLRASGDTPALVIAPATLTLTWRDEVKRWFPDTPAQVLRNGKTALDRDAQITIVSYALAKTRADELAQRGFKALVCDEAHYLKNGKAQRTQAIANLARSIPRVHLLTGTPITNRPADLVAPLKILGRLDRDFGGWYTFVTRYCQAARTRYGWDVSGADHLDELADKLRATCLVRRRKADVLAELPAKTRVIQRVDVSLAKYREAERALLDAIRCHGPRRAETDRGVGDNVLAELARALHEAGLAKAPAAVEAIHDYVDSDRKVVVFAHHKDVLDAIEAGMGDARHVRIDGDTPREARAEAVRRFQNDPDCRVFLSTTATGGTGITLTAASDVLVVEQEWVPADLDQAEDRLHRLGQTNAVQAVHLIAVGTVDEKIVSVVECKRQVMAAALAAGDPQAQEQARGSVQAQVLAGYQAQVQPQPAKTKVRKTAKQEPLRAASRQPDEHEYTHARSM